MDRPRILLLTHGGWGMGLARSMQMILGELDFVDEVALLPRHTFTEYLEAVREKLRSYPQGSLILTDLFGGTTTNVGAKLARDMGLRVVTGLSAPVLLAAAAPLLQGGAASAAEVARAGGEACKDVLAELEKTVQEKSEA